MSIDDGAAYRQPHACSSGLRGVEGVEDSIEMRWIDAGPGIADGHEGACMVLLGADHQLSWPLLYRAHCFSRVQNQVHQDLLQLNAIPQNRKQSIRKPGLDRNAIPLGDALRQYEHFVDRRIEIKAFLSRWRFLDVITHSSDDVPSSVRVPDNTIERFPGLSQIRRTHVQKPRSRTSVVACDPRCPSAERTSGQYGRSRLELAPRGCQASDIPRRSVASAVRDDMVSR